MWDAGLVVGALSYGFSVPDESYARLLACALADFGFPQVSAGPARKGGWQVRVVDDCRQYEELHGYRQREAVMRQAMAIDRQHRGYASGLTGYHPPGQPPSLARSSPQILLLNPDRHPPVPVIQSVPAPPPGLLSLEPDLPGLTPPDFTELRSTPWDELDHAYLQESLPGLISDLVLGQLEWSRFSVTLVPTLIHQGTLYPATAPALTVLGRLAAAGSLKAARRRDVYILLFRTAGQLREDLIDDTDRAQAEGREPRPQRWAAQVREAVQAITPELLARWDIEPSACRLALAGLAAEFPGHGAAVSGKITQAADEYRGTQIGEHFMLARHLISGEATMALATATAIACWDEDVRTNWIDDDLIAPGLRAIQILSETVPAAAYRTSPA
jgi:hypothetical protein